MMARHSSPPDSQSSRLGGILLNVLALVGAICAALVILGVTMNISIVLFRTGSMGPDIPAGSAALVREIPARDMAVGDVVTVERGGGQLPVTHRVVEILETDDSTGEVHFRMRGDANAEPDSQTYAAVDVRRVLGSVPGAASVIAALGRPAALGSITLASAALVLWAFWPRENSGREHADRPERPSHPTSRSPRRVRTFSGASIVALAALALTGPGAVASRAASGVPDEAIRGEYLRMQTFESENLAELTPGESATWTVGVWAESAPNGEIDVRTLVSDIPEPGQFSIDIHSCDREWSAAACSGSETALVSDIDLAELHTVELMTFPADEERWLRFDVTLEPTTTQHATVDVMVMAHGFGEEVSNGDDESGDVLVPTGAGIAGIVLALVLVATGLPIVLTRCPGNTRTER